MDRASLARSPAPNRMSGYLRALRFPVLFLVVAAALLAAYYSIYVGNNSAYLTGRNLRLIGHLGNRLETSLADHETVLSSFSSYYGDDFVRDFPCLAAVARPFVPMFEYVSLERASTPATSVDASCDDFRESPRPAGARAAPRPAVLFVADSGAGWGRRSAAGARAPDVVFRVSFRDILEPLFSRPIQGGVFDTILLATTAGDILHQEAASDIRVTALGRLRRTDPSGTDTALDFAALPLASQVLEVEMAGGRYLLYLQPCCGDLIEAGNTVGKSGLFVAGIVEAGEFRAGSMAISFSMMALMGAVILLAIFSWPFLKLLLIGEGQRLRLIDVLLVGVCSLLGTTLVTVFVVDWYSYSSLKHELDRQLERLSARISQNMLRELTLASDQLTALDRWAAGSTAGGDRVSNLFASPTLPAPVYPLMESFAHIDANGMQVRKWAAAEFATPRVSTARRQYFSYWMRPHAGAPEYFVESIRSATTGRKEAVLSKPARPPDRGDGAPSRGSQPVAVAALAIPMVSLTAPLLPPGFGFAVIDEQGQVLFHSDVRQRLDEQLFLETDRHRRLRAAVAARRAELMNVRYFGQDHRFYVAPLEHPRGANWSLVTFFDKESVRTTNIEWLVTTWLFALIYVAMYVVVCVLLLMWRSSYRAPWLWSDPAREFFWQRLVVSYTAFAAAFVLAIYRFRDADLLAAAGVFPFIVWVGTYLTLADRRTISRHRRLLQGLAAVAAAFLVIQLLSRDALVAAGTGALVAVAFALPAFDVRIRLRQSYVTAAVLLLVLTGVLPTVAFFKVAHSIQVESFVKYEQLSIARQRRAMTATPRAGLQAAATTDEIDATALRAGLSVYDEFFFGTRPCEASEAEAAARASEESIELPTAIEDLLPYYSEASVGMRELLHDEASDQAWQWRRVNGDLVLRTPARGDGSVCVRSSVPQLLAAAGAGRIDGPGYLAWAALLAGVALLVVHGIVSFVARRIFLIQIVEPLWARIAAEIPMHPGSNLFILWQAADRQAQDLAAGGRCVIDMAQCPAGQDAKWLAGQRDRLDQCPAGQAVVIDHVEHEFHDGVASASALRLINYALDVQHRTVVLVSALGVRSLLRRLADGVPAGEDAGIPDQWAAVLRRFTVLTGARVERSAEPAIAGLAATGEWQADLAGRHDSGEIWSGGDPVVRAVWEEVRRAAADRFALAPLDREQFLEEVGDRLDSYHQGLWASCSDSEKLVLEHLAREGFANEKDRRTIRVLMARGLIRKAPNLKFADDTFRRFVLSRAIGAQVAALEEGSASAWDDIRLPFFAAVLGTAAFFFLTQRELFTTTMAVITAVAGGIPAVVRVMGVFEGSGARARSE